MPVTNEASWRASVRLPICWIGLQELGSAPPSDVAHAAASVLALVLSVFSLYLQRRDRRPRLKMSLPSV